MNLNFHLMHPGEDSAPGDPNAAFYIDGKYHLHYIISHPYGDDKSFSFVHVTSSDMLHWEWETTKLQPSFTGHGMFSGTGFMTKEGLPAAIYHGFGSERNQISIAKNRSISKWKKPYPVEIKNSDGSEAQLEKHWDPDCFQVGETYYAYSGGKQQPLFKSTDLKNWTLVGDLLSHDLPETTIGEDISCPNFFRLGDKWMLLCISHSLGCRYYLGDWDVEKEQFIPTTHGRMNWKREEQDLWACFNRSDFFAPESVLTPDGRRVMWAWVISAGPEKVLKMKSIQSLPRELSLPSDGILRIKPLRELEGQRFNHRRFENINLDHPVLTHSANLPPSSPSRRSRIAEIESDAYELRIVVPRSEALRKLFGFALFSDGEGGGLPIMLRPETSAIRVGTTEAPFNPYDLPEDEDIEFRIFVDKYLVEVFINSRQALVAAHMEYEGRPGIEAYTVGAPTKISSLDIWEIKPTNQGFLKAQIDQIWKPVHQ